VIRNQRSPATRRREQAAPSHDDLVTLRRVTGLVRELRCSARFGASRASTGCDQEVGVGQGFAFYWLEDPACGLVLDGNKNGRDYDSHFIPNDRASMLTAFSPVDSMLRAQQNVVSRSV
jgi:hypothetical protein